MATLHRANKITETQIARTIAPAILVFGMGSPGTPAAGMAAGLVAKHTTRVVVGVSPIPGIGLLFSEQPDDGLHA